MLSIDIGIMVGKIKFLNGTPVDEQVFERPVQAQDVALAFEVSRQGLGESR